MTTHAKTTGLVASVESLPVATIVHLILVVSFAIVFIINNGNLPDDSAAFFAIGEAGNGLLGIGRGVAANRTKVR